MPPLMMVFVLILAVYRFTYMLIEEDGPGRMFDRIRNLFGVRLAYRTKTINGEIFQVPYRTADNTIGRVLSCFYCCSVWIGFIGAIYPSITYPIFRGLPFDILIYGLAFSGAAITIYEANKR